MSYNWLATIAFVLTLFVVSKVGVFLVFKVPALAKTRQMLAAVQENARNAGVDLSDAAT